MDKYAVPWCDLTNTIGQLRQLNFPYRTFLKFIKTTMFQFFDKNTVCVVKFHIALAVKLGFFWIPAVSITFQAQHWTERMTFV